MMESGTPSLPRRRESTMLKADSTYTLKAGTSPSRARWTPPPAKRDGTGVTALFTALFMLTSCLFDNEVAGGSTTTDNAFVPTTIMGAVQNPDGTGASASVHIRPEDYLSPVAGRARLLKNSPITVVDTRTDNEGMFTVDSLDPGRYLVELVSDNFATDSLSLAVRIELDSGQQLTLTDNAMIPASVIQGTVNMPAGKTDSRLRIFGLERYVTVDPVTGRFEVAVPAGVFDLYFSSPFEASKADTLIGVEALSGMVRPVGVVHPGNLNVTYPYRDWKHTIKIYINTSGDGANVSENLSAFPLLVRLLPSDPGAASVFAAAGPGGSDLRFSTADLQTSLPFEIERWDDTQGKAEIWVRTDVAGHSSGQYIMMFAGNDTAVTESSPSRVFDSSQGYRAVWHLNQAGSNDSGAYLDATGNGNHLTGNGMSPASTVEGQTGPAQLFDGASTYLTAPHDASFDVATGDFTLSAHFRMDVNVFNGQIFSKLDDTGHLELEIADRLSALVNEPGDRFEVPGVLPITTDVWYHAVLTRQNGICYLYLDGVPDASLACPADVNSLADVHIGRDGRNATAGFFNGAIDEVRLLSVGRSADWVKFSSLNQGAPGGILSIHQ